MNNVNGMINSAHIEAENLIFNIGKTVLIHGVVYKIKKVERICICIAANQKGSGSVCMGTRIFRFSNR